MTRVAWINQIAGIWLIVFVAHPHGDAGTSYRKLVTGRLRPVAPYRAGRLSIPAGLASGAERSRSRQSRDHSEHDRNVGGPAQTDA